MKRQGMTVAEVLVALSIIGVVVAAFTGIFLGSMTHTRSSGSRTEAVQLVNYLGRRLLAGEAEMLPALHTGNGAPSGDSVRKWDYGSLTTAFPDLPSEENLANPDLYSVQITNLGNQTVFEMQLPAYKLEACWRISGEDSCVVAETIGPAPSGSTDDTLADEIPVFN